ncbi:MAG: 2-phospho-L-lactate guanylyltransferase [Methanosarcinaceae archaeon]|nr:2-phospho-L-lactate guanylyltransferase [Methanosarcinaceae archaeon]
MRAVIPYKKPNAKSRLSSVLELHEREEFVEFMLKDVVTAISKGGIEAIDIITTSAGSVVDDIEANVIVNELGLNEALNGYLKIVNEPVLIVMADLPLMTPLHIKEITASDKDVVIVPGKGGGTNVLFIRDPTSFYVKYYDSSFLSHCDIAREKSQSFEVYDSFLVSTDIDEPHDLVELLLHGQGLSKSYIQKRFGIEVSKGRVKLQPHQKFNSKIGEMVE